MKESDTRIRTYGDFTEQGSNLTGQRAKGIKEPVFQSELSTFQKDKKITVGPKMTSTKCDSLGKTDKVWKIQKKMWRKSFLHAHVPLCTTVRDLPSPRSALAFFKAHSVGKPFPSLPQTGLSTCGHPSPPQASFINNT